MLRNAVAAHKRVTELVQGHPVVYIARFVVTELRCLHTPTTPTTSISGPCSHLHTQVGRYTCMSTVHHMWHVFSCRLHRACSLKALISAVAIMYSNIANGPVCVCVCAAHT